MGVGSFFRLCSAVFLVAGTCIGGGILALPVTCSSIGFYPSITVMIGAWIFMTLCALLIMEASLWFAGDAHLISLSGRLLGKPGRALAWLVGLFISYASLVAYIDGAGEQIAFSLTQLVGYAVTKSKGAAFFALTFGLILAFGKEVLGKANSVLFLALLVSYVILISMGIGDVNDDLLEKVGWQDSSIFSTAVTIPLMLTSFSFGVVVPSLLSYVDNNPRALRGAIIAGTTVTLVINVLWQYMVMGTVPIEGSHGLMEAYVRGESALTGLRYAISSPYLKQVANFFAFFAIVTSFLGIALALFDMLADGLDIPKKGWGTFFLLGLVICPSLIGALFCPRAFVVALETTGGFGDAIISGMIPVAMVWTGRYSQGRTGPFRLFGGKPLLIVVFAVSVSIFCIELVRVIL